MNSAAVWISSAAGLACAVLGVLAAGDVHAPLGDSDPGLATTILVTVARFAAEGAGLLAAGALAFAALVVPRRARDEALTADAYAATRTAGAAATAWTVAAMAMVPLSAADATGQSLGEVWAVLPGLVDATEEPKAWLCSAVAAVVVAVGTRAALRWPPLVLWLVVAAAGLVAPVVAGHVAAGEWHDVATNAMVWHVLAAAVWVGALVSLWSFLRRPAARERGRVLRRYHRLTLGCLVVLVVSGSVTGLALARPAGLMTGYGFLLLLKLAVCGLVLLLRRWRGTRWPVAVELVVLGVAMGATVGLAHLVPPAFLSDPSSITEILLGYELPTAPTVGALLTAWRFDLLFGTAAIAAAVWYLRAVRVLRGRGDRWPAVRTVAWLAGCLVVVVVTSSGVGRFAPGTFSMHMVVHMALNMLAPALLVQGGPITLALRTLSPGPRQWLVSLLHSRAARVLAHPAFATVVFVGSYYALYLTPLFGEAMLFHWAHQLMNLHFLVSGYVFYWLVAGVDRPPRPLVHPAKLGMLFAVMPFHAFFGVILMSTSTVIAGTYYRYLSLPWVPDLLADQRLGGGIAWAAGELPVVLVLVALLRQWAAADQREATRTDRRLDSGMNNGGDDRLAAYNAMLAELAGQRHENGRHDGESTIR
ncbi:cytochrome c oxidase assembly protein [Actinophytocola algeriensis]|uniref:Putative copper resistance protein D n=1 Tax=Actinophytocola algeriensis TaxID=1768010 RepID=A0A7W7VDC2_9PSEU|nr:cytochrome c oxidase assembly protein [Actinophytocola algeriensis]MBB4906012.1 putative copper resistance protein D [Actinophytocola algeriensis]MBE1472303.1 putative copper resistance protein D [Actinophytocola algeriensis]